MNKEIRMLRKTTLSVFALVLGALAVFVPARAGNLPENLIPEGTRWVAHLDMEKFVSTQLFKLLDMENGLQINNRDITRMLKIDFFKDITGLTVFGFGPEGKRGVFLAAGRFDKKRLLTLAELSDNLKEIAYGGNIIYTTDHNEYGAFVNDGLIAFGERREDIERVLDAASGKARNFAGSALNASLKAASSGSFLSGVFEDLSGLDADFRESKFMGKAKGLTFLAQEKQDTLQIHLQVTADSPESAKDMAEIAQGLLAMARLSRNEGEGRGWANLAKDARFEASGNVVRLDLSLPSSEAARMMSHGRMSLAGIFD